MAISIIIIDDELENVLHLKSLAAQLSWPAVNVWPFDGREIPFKSWDKASTQILRLSRDEEWDPNLQCCILILDVALGTQLSALEAGVSALEKRAKQSLWKKYCLVAWTKWAAQS